MRMILGLIFTMLLGSNSWATLTNTYVTVVKNASASCPSGGGTCPSYQNGSIVDTGTSSGPGNVGIGSANPGQALDVNGTVRATAVITSTISSASPGPVVLQPTLANNVGIGSVTPGTALDVAGTVRATGFTGDATNLTNLPITLTTTGSSGASTYTQSTNTLNVPQYSGGGSSQWLTIGGANNVGISTTDTVGIGTTLSTGGGLLVMNGNVGIGTWKPAFSLHLGDIIGYGNGTGVFATTSGTIAASGTIESNNFACGNVTSANCGFVGSNTLNLYNGGANSTFQMNNDAGGAADGGKIIGGTSSGNSLILQVSSANSSGGTVQINGGNAGATKISTFFDSGNVGIGTTIDNAGLVQLKHNSSAQGEVACIGLSSTGTCLGYCSGTITDAGGACSACTCL